MKLESVKRRWLRVVKGMDGLDYLVRMRSSGLYSVYRSLSR